MSGGVVQPFDLVVAARQDATPVLLLTAKDTVADRIGGLDTGADDYLGKPFDLDEVAARLRAISRRASGRASPVLAWNGVELDPGRRTVEVDGKPVGLSRREFSILEALMRHPGTVLSKDQLADRLTGAGTVVVSGRGLVLGTALEIALKIEETCLRPVRGYSYADLRHGPISVVGEGVTALLAAPQDGPLVHGMTELARDLRGRGADVVGIGGDDAFAGACDLAVPGPDLPEVLAPLGLVVPAQHPEAHVAQHLEIL